MALNTVINNLPYSNRVRSIVSAKATDTSNYRYIEDIIIHTKNDNLKSSLVLKQDIKSDYLTALTDETTITAVYSLYTVMRLLLPNRDNLEITISVVTGNYRVKETYKAVLLNIDELDIHKSVPDSKLKDATLQLDIQLVNLLTEPMHNYRVNTILEKATMEDTLISTIKNKFLEGVKLINDRDTYNITLDPADNERVYDQVVIGANTLLTGLPSYLQDKYGVYNGSINLYIDTDGKDNHIYIFKPYGIPVSTKERLEIYTVSDAVFSVLEVTYSLSNNNLLLLSNNTDSFVNTDTDKLKDKGNTLITKDSNRKFSRKIDNGKIKVDKPTVTAHKQLNDNDAPVRDIVQTDNTYKYRSDIIADVGNIVSITWSNSIDSYIYPGMYTEYYTVDEGMEVVKHIGRVIGKHTTIDNNSKKSVTRVLLWLIPEPETEGKQVISKINITDYSNRIIKQLKGILNG